jgi:dTDP-4-dehydrorhamnose reductase
LIESLANRLPLLITGITGVAGFNALSYFRRRYSGQVIGIRPLQTQKLNGEKIIPLDAENAEGMRNLFRTFRFRSVLHCAGNCALKACELDSAMARCLNVAAAANVVANVQQWGARLVHLSSDLVFSGKGSGNYLETDPADPVTVYGKTMEEAEVLVRERVPAAAILRISLPMGPSFNRHAGAIDWIRSRFRKGRHATLYFDEVRSCAYVEDMNRVYEQFLAGRETGLFHLGGPRALTLYQIAQIINRVGGFEPTLLKGCFRKEAGPVPPRAGNVSMCSDKLVANLGQNPCKPWPQDKDLLPTDKEWHCRRNGEEGSFQEIRRKLYSY